MKSDNGSSKEQRENYSHLTRDRLDWVSKYLELADKIMDTHKPEKAKEGEKY